MCVCPPLSLQCSRVALACLRRSRRCTLLVRLQGFYFINVLFEGQVKAKPKNRVRLCCASFFSLFMCSLFACSAALCCRGAVCVRVCVCLCVGEKERQRSEQAAAQREGESSAAFLPFFSENLATLTHYR